MTYTPRAPKGLLSRGKALWRSVHRDYEPSPAEVQILHELCRTLDEIDTLAMILTNTDPIVTGSTGQPKINGVYAELRQHRAVADRLAQALGLSDARRRR